jgi:peptidylamidoglycolate lyase
VYLLFSLYGQSPTFGIKGGVNIATLVVEQLPSIAIDKADHLFAIDYDPTKKLDSTGSTIFEFDSSQHVKNHFGVTGSANRTTCWFHDIAIDSKGNIYVGDIIGLKVLKFKPKVILKNMV